MVNLKAFWNTLKHTSKAKRKQRDIAYTQISCRQYIQITDLTRALRQYHAVIGCEKTPIFIHQIQYLDGKSPAYVTYTITGRHGTAIPSNKCQWCNLFPDIDDQELSTWHRWIW